MQDNEPKPPPPHPSMPQHEEDKDIYEGPQADSQQPTTNNQPGQFTN